MFRITRTGYGTHEWLTDEHFLQRHVPAPDLEAIQRAMATARASGQDQRFEHRFTAKDGRELWFQTGIQVDKEDQRARWLRGICIEITPLKRSLDENRQLLELSRIDLQLLRNERELRDRFVSTITHDLRNPLAAAKLGAQVLGKGLTDPGQVKRNERVISNIARADKMIQDLLDASRIRAGQRIPMSLGPTCLAAVLGETVEELTALYGNRFHLHVEGDVRGTWYADGLRRVAENLMINGVKYGELHAPITVRLCGEGERVRFSVHNRGNEIPPAEQPHLFEPFRRATAAERGSQLGWGLGLTVVRGIVHAHGGRVWVTSAPEVGTTFFVELPRHSAAA